MAIHKWTEEEMQKLRVWHAEGLSMAVMAGRLNNVVSRSAVLGKCRRMGLVRNHISVPGTNKKCIANHSGNQTVFKKKPKKPKRAVRNTKTGAPPPVEPLNIDLMDLTNSTCRYPYATKSGTVFCGHPVEEGSVYCAHHSALCKGQKGDNRT